jgi:hypothetical protein
MKNIYLLLISVSLFLFACNKGEKLDNFAPETRISLISIDLTGGSRLNSVFTLHWSGEDRDGYVAKYEFSFDGTNWTETKNQDSTFRFSISGNSDTMDIHFWVRAIDNDNAKDATPATLRIPIKNTAPTVLLDATKPIPDTVFSVFSTLWKASDLDGDETIDSVYIKLNNGSWYSLPKTTTFITIVPQNPKNSGTQNAKIYKGSNALLQTALLSALNVGGDNRLYIKVKDNAGTFSATDSSSLFFVKRQTGNTLVIDDFASTVSPTPESVYFPILDNLGVSYDAISLAAHEPPFWEPTLELLLNLYDKVFWYSDGTEYTKYGDLMYLEVGAQSLQSYLNKGGKVFISTKLPISFNDKAKKAYNSVLYNFTPIDSFSTSAGQARIPVDSLVYPTNSFASTYPTLKPASFMTGVDPFYAKNGNQNMYLAEIQRTGGWIGSNSIIGNSTFTNGKINQVFVSVELHKLNGDASALQTFFGKVLNEEFVW